jgi:hypothetical protein
MTESPYKVEPWTVRKICEAYEQTGETHLIVPRFQRMLVWTEAKKRDLIQSVKQGFPIGSFLMYPQVEGKKTHYLLIDGLQRSEALTSFRNQPMKWVDRDEMVECAPPLELLSRRMDVSLVTEGRTLEEALLAWLKKRTSFEESDGWSAYGFVCDIFKAFDKKVQMNDIDALRDDVLRFLNKLKHKSNIDDFGIPVIIYHGPFENLPDIFERLNTTGTRLNKYQIFAAAWNTETVQFENTTIQNAIKDRYRAFVNKAAVELQVDPDKLGSEGFEFTLFEYFLGLDKALQKEFRYLFGAESDDSQTGSASFNLVAAILEVPFSEMQEGLKKKLHGLDLDALYARISKACAELWSYLQPFLAMPANNKKVRIYHAEYQIITYIARIYMEMFDSEGRCKKTWQSMKPKLQAALPHHYLYDILSDSWAGHGDSHMREMLGPRKDELLQPVRQTDWEALLNKWFEAQLNRSEKVPRIDPTTILFLKYLYSKSKSVYDAFSEPCDGEHLIPKNRLKNMIKRLELPDISMSNVGNISLLRIKVNRGKGDKTLLEQLRQLPNYANASEEKKREMEKRVAENALLYDIHDLDFDGQNNDQGLTKEWYVNFCRSRFKHLKEIFFKKFIKEE